MAKQTNLDTFVGGFAKTPENQWQGDVWLSGMNTDEGAFIAAHKVILAARSEVFKMMFESDEIKTSAKLETVTLSEMKHEEVETLVEFIDSDGSKLSAKGKGKVLSLFTAAHKYEILYLGDLCRTELISSLDLMNVLDLLKLSLPSDIVLPHAAKNYILRNFKKIVFSEEFRLFAKKDPLLTVGITW